RGGTPAGPPPPPRGPHRPHRAAGPGSPPRPRPPPPGGAVYPPSSRPRTAPAGPATGIPSGSGRTPRRSPAGDHSTAAPAWDAPAATAPAAPTPHRSGHVVSAGPLPRPSSKPKRQPRSTGHALVRAGQRPPDRRTAYGPPPLVKPPAPSARDAGSRWFGRERAAVTTGATASAGGMTGDCPRRGRRQMPRPA